MKKLILSRAHGPGVQPQVQRVPGRAARLPQEHHAQAPEGTAGSASEWRQVP